MMIKCPICLLEKNKIKNLLCFHSFCSECWKGWEINCKNNKKNLSCPLCKRIISTIDDKDDEVKILKGDYYKRFTEDKNDLEF